MRTEIRGHDDDAVAKVHFPTMRVRQMAFVKKLQPTSQNKAVRDLFEARTEHSARSTDRPAAPVELTIDSRRLDAPYT